MFLSTEVISFLMCRQTLPPSCLVTQFAENTNLFLGKFLEAFVESVQITDRMVT